MPNMTQFLQGPSIDYNTTLLDELDRVVSLFPDKVAVYDLEHKITFKEFQTISDNLAKKLKESQSDFIFIISERSIWIPIFFWASIKAGKVYSPIDASLPDDRIKTMVTGVENFTIYSSRAVSNLDHDINPIDGLHFSDLLKNPHKLFKNHDHTSNKAFLLYTSGTTGSPKGIIGTQSGLVNRMMWMKEEFEINCYDVIMYKTPISFDVHLWEIIVPLITGATMFVLGPQDHKMIHRLIKKIIDEKITRIHFVPSVLRLFCKYVKTPSTFNLKSVFASGEALKVTDAITFNALFQQVELVNLYGPAEASVDVTYYRLSKNENISTIPIGKPIANVTIYILDKNLKQVPLGAEGEIYLAGIALADSYTSSELSAQKFLPCPFGNNNKMYKTGDLGKINDSGELLYLGREDSQVKVNGVRIELGEIEFQIESYEGISDVAVIYNREMSQILAYYVGNIDRSSIKSHLEQRLPSAFIPSQFHQVKEIPISPNGKRDLTKFKID